LVYEQGVKYRSRPSAGIFLLWCAMSPDSGCPAGSIDEACTHATAPSHGSLCASMSTNSFRSASKSNTISRSRAAATGSVVSCAINRKRSTSCQRSFHSLSVMAPPCADPPAGMGIGSSNCEIIAARWGIVPAPTPPAAGKVSVGRTPGPVGAKSNRSWRYLSARSQTR